MDITLPVYLYDVVTTDEAPRVVVSCRTEQAAVDLAAALNAAPRDGTERFVVGERRVAAVTMPVEPGSSVTVRGYEVASEVLAAAIATIPPPPEPVVEEPVVDPPPPEEPAP